MKQVFCIIKYDLLCVFLVHNKWYGKNTVENTIITTSSTTIPMSPCSSTVSLLMLKVRLGDKFTSNGKSVYLQHSFTKKLQLQEISETDPL